MDITIRIPDKLAERLGPDAERRLIEAFALEEFRAGRMTKPELRQLLGLSRYKLDGLLKAHGIYEQYTLEDLEREREVLKRLGF